MLNNRYIKKENKTIELLITFKALQVTSFKNSITTIHYQQFRVQQKRVYHFKIVIVDIVLRRKH